jgi:hypothetical protein
VVSCCFARAFSAISGDSFGLVLEIFINYAMERKSALMEDVKAANGRIMTASYSSTTITPCRDRQCERDVLGLMGIARGVAI